MDKSDIEELELYLKEKRTAYWEENGSLPNLYDVLDTDRMAGLSLRDKLYMLDEGNRALAV